MTEEGSEKGYNITYKDSLLLIIILAGFSTFMAFVSYMRYTNFYTTNWDMGINLQLLWTTTHGYLMFETADYSTFGTYSFLQVHSTYIAYPVALLYHYFPNVSTLVILQSIVVASSAVPLFLIASKLLDNRLLIFCVVIAYLLNFALISAMLYDFHWEAFIPVEYLSMFYLLYRKKYVLGLIPFFLGDVTIEVFPLLVGGMAIYFAYTRYGIEFLKLNKMIFKKDWVIYLSYFLLAAFSYFFIRYLQIKLIPTLIGVQQVSGLGSSVTVLSPVNFTAGSLVFSLIYWALLYASFGFISLFDRKHLIMALPWFIGSVFVNQVFSSYYGDQYAFVAISPVVIGFIFGLSKIVSSGRSWLKTIPLAIPIASILIFSAINGYSRYFLSPNPENGAIVLSILFVPPIAAIILYTMLNRNHSAVSSRGRHFVGLKRVSYFIVILMVLFSLVISPLNLTNFQASPMPGYQVSYDINPQFHEAIQIAHLIPDNSKVLASDNLFPMVANNPNAYSLLWFPYAQSALPNLPYNSDNLPQYVFLDTAQFNLAPPFIINSVFNSTLYGLKAYSFSSSFPGYLYLFQKGYVGNPTIYRNPIVQKQYYFAANNLSVGPSGSVVVNSSSMFGSAIISKNGTSHNIWYGPYVTLPVGMYEVTINLTGKLSNTSLPTNTTLLKVSGGGIGSPAFYSSNISSEQLSGKSWSDLNFTFNVTKPYPLDEFRGCLNYINGTAVGDVTLNYIHIRYISS